METFSGISPRPVFTKILTLKMSLILRISLRIAVFYKKISEIKNFAIHKSFILTITLIFRLFFIRIVIFLEFF